MQIINVFSANSLLFTGFRRVYALFVRRVTEPLPKERLNTSIDTSKENNNIKTHPLLLARDELKLEIFIFLNFL